jgi:hypothetical protein
MDANDVSFHQHAVTEILIKEVLQIYLTDFVTATEIPASVPEVCDVEQNTSKTAINTADLPHSSQPWNATRKFMCSSQTKGQQS